MPVHHQKKDTTPDTLGSTQEQTAPALPDQQIFQQYLRELARAALRVVLEGVMREELDALIGVGWGQNSRQQQRVSQRLLHPRFGHLWRLASRRSTCLETVKRSSTHRSLNATVAMNPLSRDQIDPYVCSRDKHARSVGEVAQTLMGVAGIRQHDYLSQPEPDPAI
jgi:hypothetical protein